MKVLIIGSGGREHAIAWKVAQSPEVEKVYCAPGNGGTEEENKCINVNLKSIPDLVSFAKEEAVDLTIVGPEQPLIDGITDVFKSEGLRIFGPSQRAALLEGSKIFSKDFMKKYGIKTAQYETFTSFQKALEYTGVCTYPIVIKADGLAAGKGVSICYNKGEAASTLKSFMISDIFKGSGKKVVIEEYLEGVEASILSITDGNTIIPFLSSKDHKAIFDGNHGPNTGGMGAIAPNPYCTKEVLEDFERNILAPTLNGINAENLDFTGIIFFGIMITERGVYLLEYNVRMGDPETQAVLPLMESDFSKLVYSAAEKTLKDFKLEWKAGFSCCIIAASGGYPGSYETGSDIVIADKLNSKVFAGGADKINGKLKTNGGRVLGVTSIGSTLEEAIAHAYEDMAEVDFKNMYYRKDIGKSY